MSSKEKFYKREYDYDGGEYSWEPAEGYRVELTKRPKIVGFVCKDSGFWEVTEAKTGLKATRSGDICETRKAAVEVARSNIRDAGGVRKLADFIKWSVLEGYDKLSPLYREGE